MMGVTGGKMCAIPFCERCLGGLGLCSIILFFKQKTAYGVGTGDWSSDVCSSDLLIFMYVIVFFDNSVSLIVVTYTHTSA